MTTALPTTSNPDDQGGPTGDLDGDGLTNEREDELGTDPENPDTDGDGVGDGDEDAAGTDPLDNASYADTDGDLVPDAVEVAGDTDPNDPASFVDSDAGGTADHIETVTYASYGLSATDALDPGDDRRDFDGDGLPDRLEISVASDPAASDSPTTGGAGDDNDNGISNAVEAYLAGLGIAPVTAVSDFDRDGYPDVAEIGFALNPLSASESDSDGDGVPNIIEPWQASTSTPPPIRMPTAFRMRVRSAWFRIRWTPIRRWQTAPWTTTATVSAMPSRMCCRRSAQQRALTKAPTLMETASAMPMRFASAETRCTTSNRCRGSSWRRAVPER